MQSLTAWFYAGKSLTKQLMVAVESALQERFGSHAGWAHNTLFISELASQRHVLPAHLHPGYRGRAPKKARDLGEGVALDPEGPVTPPQQLSRGQRSAARSASAKRTAADMSSVKQEQEEDGLSGNAVLSQPGVSSALQPAVEQPERSKCDVYPDLRVQGSQQSAIVSKVLEGAAMEAFAQVRQIDADSKAEVADAAGHAEKYRVNGADSAASSGRKSRKAALRRAQPASPDEKT